MLQLPVIEGKEPLTAHVTRELDSVDLAMTGSVVGATPLKRIRARHHAVARALASGMRPGIVAATLGYTAARISVLQSDPAFQELIAHYKQEIDADYAEIKARMTNIATDALDEIAERLEDSPEDVTMPQLIKLVEITADRTGHGPKAVTDVNVNINLAERLRAARERLAAPTVIDHEDDQP